MRIFIDTKELKFGLTLNEIFYLDKCFQLLINRHPNHQWLNDVEEKTTGIISLLPVGIKKAWHIRKYRPDLLISASPNFDFQPSLKQIVFINEHFLSRKKKKIHLDAWHVAVTTSAALKKNAVEQNQSNEAYIHFIPGAAEEEFSPADWSQKLYMKEKYTDGRDFFLCFKTIGRNTRWEEMLKAFSIFKKWQQSSFKLVLVGKIDLSFEEEFREKLDSYKYKTDVTIIDPQKEDLTQILPCAFGVICGETDHTGMNLLNAFKCEVPVICSPLELFDDAVSGAFVPAMPAADELSRQIINLYRDERMRDIMVQKGKEYLSAYSWELVANKWDGIIENLSAT